MSPLVYAHPDGRVVRLGDGAGIGTWDTSERFNPGDTPVAGENVGVITGVNRSTHSGDLVLTSAMNGTPSNPTIIENLDITGVLRTSGNNIQNIHIRNVRILMGPDPNPGTTTDHVGVKLWGTGKSNVVVEDFEVAPTHPSVGVYGVYAWDATLRRFYVHDCTDLLSLNNQHAVFEGGLIERSRHWLVDPRHSNGPAHNDAVQIHGGGGHVLRDMVIDSGVGPDATRGDGDVGGNFGILMTNGTSVINGVTFERIAFRGNPYSHIQTGDVGKGAMAGVVVDTCSFTDSRNANIRMSPETMAATTFTNLTTSTGDPLPTSEIEGAVGQR